MGAGNSRKSSRGSRGTPGAMPLLLSETTETPGDELSALRFHRGDILNRRWSAELLFFGALCGFLAFSLATLVGTFGSWNGEALKHACFNGHQCPSGRYYHAETVSEMVSRPKEPAGKIFYSFTIIASVCLLVSRYPWELINVFTGNRYVDTLRAVLPPIGMMVVAQIPVVPRAERTTPDVQLACSIHTFGAVLFVFGYNVLELFTLRLIWKKRGDTEKWLRLVCVISSSACMLGFVIFGAVYTHAEDWNICCKDEYIDTSQAFASEFGFDNTTQNGQMQAALIGKLYGTKVLSNSATGTALFVKKGEFWSEMIAGIFIIASHFLIWLYSEGRLLKIPPVVTISDLTAYENVGDRGKVVIDALKGGICQPCCP